MPSYAEDLAADRDRLRRALVGLIEEQQVVVLQLTDDLQRGRERLDRAVLKLLLFNQQFGRGAAETISVQREAEDANTPVIEIGRRLERQQAVLALYRQRLAELDAGQLRLFGEAPTVA